MSLPAENVIEFPHDEVRAALEAEFLDAAEDAATIEGKEMPSDRLAAISFRIAIDSISAVDILCDIQDIVERDLKSTLVKRGGYSSAEEAVEDLLPKIERVWIEKKEQKKEAAK